MSLFSSIQMAGNSLGANSIALQVLGQNISNANTPGYIREDIQLSPGSTQRMGNLLLGTGVQVDAVTQQIDLFLEDRLRGALSDQANTSVAQDTYSQLEALVGQLSDTGLSNSMTDFFNSISEVLNQPESATVRNLAVLQGDTLSKDFNNISKQAAQLRSDTDTQIKNMADDINRLVEQVRTLNIKIAQAENANSSKSDAVGLRDQRLTALQDLAKLTSIRTVEQTGGSVTVYAGSDYLVYEGLSHQVEAVEDSQNGSTSTSIHIVGTDAPLDPTSGKLRGLLDARDKVLGGFTDQLNSLASSLAFEFNKVYSRGQGLTGYSKLTGDFSATDKTAPLNAAGLPFTPTNGSFQILVHNKKTNLTQTTDIHVDLTGLGSDTTLSDLADQLNKVPGISADITTSGNLTIASLSADTDFSFANDDSGTLAALGINTFFSGSTAADLAVSSQVRNDPSKFAASSGGIAADTQNAAALATLIDAPMDARGGASLNELYQRLASETTQSSAIAKANADGSHVYVSTLSSQRLSISGVNIDEEAVKMMAYQRAYQASARYISTLNSLLELLVQL
jgi:flagellar hook-associated protein 1